ncbi:tetratricopeptide repeat protein [Turneriella parva]|nr:tetratricopeptide repeat protein [Turneriella parva]
MEEANQFFEIGEFDQALAKYEQVLKLEPKHSDALYNGGMASHLGGKPARAAELWEILKLERPTDFQLHAKLVQAYAAVGDAAKTDSARNEIFALYGKLGAKERAGRESYCREQFVRKGFRVLALEFFELTGERAVRYAFVVLTADGKEDYRISLGSYDATTKISRELGEIGPKERVFHLDGYYKGGREHRTFEMYLGEPKYEEIKRTVIEILDGKKKASSSTKSK